MAGIVSALGRIFSLDGEIYINNIFLRVKLLLFDKGDCVMTIVSKKAMTEEEIKLYYITPALITKWNQHIRMEYYFTDGRIDIRGNMVTRRSPKKADYVLYYNANTPLAVVEAKDNKHSVSFGLQQAMEYAKMLDVPFAYSSNGDAFMEHDFFTGKERNIALEDFPTQEELYLRFKQGKALSSAQETIIRQPYYSSQNTYAPRYYRQVAVNRTVEAIASGKKRLLLVMATGTGKTCVAFQIVYRLLQSRQISKVLYLADRNILVDQSIEQDFAPLKNIVHKINFAHEDTAKISSYSVYFSLYHQLSTREDDGDENDIVEKLGKLFSRDFFDLIIVDECHRGSAKRDSRWRRILEYFSSAAQLGMTATPKETKYISNIDYFGEPLYTYSLKEGIEDGFLAPFKVIRITTNIHEGWRPHKGQKDFYGKEIEDRIYTNSDFDYTIILQDRINQVAAEITKYLKSTDRMAKTIVFCATEDAAERMRIALVNANSDMVQQNSDYVVRITGSDAYGKNKLDYFISVSEKYPVIATTSKLLSTGVDCKMVKLIVLDQMIGSMTEFKQIIGRGTRLRYREGKRCFVVMDFRNVTQLFADPEWDGPITIDGEYDPNQSPPYPAQKHSGNGCHEDEPKPFVDAHGCRVQVINKVVAVYDADGKLLRQEDIVDYTKQNIRNDFASLANFIRQWSAKDKKEAIARELQEKYHIDLEMLKKQQNLQDVDDFDFICHVAFDKKPLTRKERANNVKKRDFLSRYSGVARQVLDALLEKYMNVGIYEIEKTEILKLDPFRRLGKPAKIAQAFGGREAYKQAVKELEQAIYEEDAV